MARPSKEFDLAWPALTGVRPEQGWTTISVPAAGPVAVYAGRRAPENREAILFAFPTVRLGAAERLPEGQGFSVERVDPAGDGRLWLGLTRSESGSMEMFTVMACDVAGALDHAASAGAPERDLLKTLVSRVRAWQEFMRNGAKPLSSEAELGLIGELLVLGAVIDSGVMTATAVEAWVGPLGGLRDFELGMGALEVKSTISPSGFTARVGSLEQLADTERQPLYLVGARLREAAAGKSLSQWVAEVHSRVAADPRAGLMLSERIASAGYFDVHAKYYERRVELLELQAHEVAAGFPRLTRATVPPGVVRAVYDIDLNQVGAGCELDAALRRLGAI